MSQWIWDTSMPNRLIAAAPTEPVTCSSTGARASSARAIRSSLSTSGARLSTWATANCRAHAPTWTIGEGECSLLATTPSITFRSRSARTPSATPGRRGKAPPPELPGPYVSWIRRSHGKPVPRNLTAEQEQRYRPWFDNARRLRELLTELEKLSLDAFEQAEGTREQRK